MKPPLKYIKAVPYRVTIGEFWRRVLRNETFNEDHLDTRHRWYHKVRSR